MKVIKENNEWKLKEEIMDDIIYDFEIYKKSESNIIFKCNLGIKQGILYFVMDRVNDHYKLQDYALKPKSISMNGQLNGGKARKKDLKEILNFLNKYKTNFKREDDQKAIFYKI